MEHQVAVYGTLRRDDSRFGALSASQFKGMGKLPSNIALYDYGAFPFIKTEERIVEPQVTCEVYVVDDKTLSVLDSIEGHPHFYERKQVNIEGHGLSWVYFLEEAEGPQIESGDWIEYRAA